MFCFSFSKSHPPLSCKPRKRLLKELTLVEYLEMLPPPSFALSPSLFFFLLFLFIPCLSQDHEIYASCAARSCGNIPAENISYPFWFEGQPEYCGHPNYKLYCTNNLSTQIGISSERFGVESINPERHTLTLVDEDLAASSCTTRYANTTIDHSVFNFSDQDLSITLYYECPQEVPFDYLSFFPLPCDGGTYAVFTLLPPHNASYESCKFVNITLSNMVKSLLQPHQPLSADGWPLFRNAVRMGFEVTWPSFDVSWCSGCVGSGGRCGYNPALPQQHICLCQDEPREANCQGKKTKSGRDGRRNVVLRIAIGTSMTAAVVFLLLFVFLKFFLRQGIHGAVCFCTKEHKDDQAIEKFLKSYGSVVPKRYHYADLKKITNSFKDKLGQGGFGGVFKGKLQDGRLVAVKVLSSSKCNGEEFMNEVASIGRTNHVNIVNLLGFCSNRTRRALIYEFMPNGSLEQFIYEKTRKANPLGWKKLYEIAMGIARGLDYLHRGCSTRIVHLDIKPHNILLDQDFQPKISDFGLAKICPPKESFVSMLGARGTVGYIAPEVFCRNFGGVSHKSDVYSYGMMVMEMAGGRSNFEATAEKSSQMYFPDWIYKRVELNEHLELHGITVIEEEEIARKMIIVALWCIQVDPADRPTTSRVVEMLEGSVESLPIPPRPFFASPSPTLQPQSPVSTS